MRRYSAVLAMDPTSGETAAKSLLGIRTSTLSDSFEVLLSILEIWWALESRDAATAVEVV